MHQRAGTRQLVRHHLHPDPHAQRFGNGREFLDAEGLSAPLTKTVEDAPRMVDPFQQNVDQAGRDRQAALSQKRQDIFDVVRQFATR